MTLTYYRCIGGTTITRRDHVFSNDFQVCLKIYEFNQKGEKIWFSKLVKEMKGKPTQSTISKSLDKLFDRGMIDGDWEKVDGSWTRTLKITGEFTGFVKGLYNVAKDLED